MKRMMKVILFCIVLCTKNVNFVIQHKYGLVIICLKRMSKSLTFIDLFCGAGGMSTGFEMAGFTPVLAIDNWQDALDTYLLK